jgi:hypothetical protein
MPIDNVKFKYVFSEDHNPVVINGAYGGFSGRGEFVLHFYFERNPIPNHQVVHVEEGDKGKYILKERIKSIDPEDIQTTFIRFIQTGIVMDYATTKEIHQWIGEKIEAFEKENGLKKAE